MKLFRFDHHRARGRTGAPGSVFIPGFYRFRALACVPAFLLALHAAPVAAVDFSDGSLTGRLDTTVSHGLMFRTENRAKFLLDDVNGDDGNLNYNRGLISSASKITSELEVQSGYLGFFARASAFYDSENFDGKRERTELSDGAKRQVGGDATILDLYMTGEFETDRGIGSVRAGNQVINWGESTFIPNGISVINPFDVSKLRVPGAELREAVLPVPAVSASFAPADELSVEAFVQLDWKPMEIDPVGSFFSTTDYVGEGGRKAVLFSPDPRLPLPFTDTGYSFEPLTPAIKADLGAALGPLVRLDHPDFGSIPRARDREPDNARDWGIAARVFSEQLNDTEFGFYFINYASRLPLIGGRAGDQASVLGAQGVAGSVLAPTSYTTQAITQAVTPGVTQAVTKAVTQAVTQQVSAQIPPGTPNRQQLIQQQVAAQVPALVAQRLPAEIGKEVGTRVGGVATLLALDTYGSKAGYFVEYPEDIQLFGVSFNTLLGATGWALQGEYSLRQNAPLQIEDSALLQSALTSLCVVPQHPLYPIFRNFCANPLGPAPVEPGEVIRGYVLRDVSQVQATATKVFSQVAGADSLTFLIEGAAMIVHDMPSKATTPLDAPGGSLADATSVGYRAAAVLSYSNAVGAVRLSPRLQFAHDVNGSSPGPAGPFVEGRYAVTLGLQASYLDRWSADVSYTQFAGAGIRNTLIDRDFLTLSLKYSF